MDYQDINAATIDRRIEEGRERGKPIGHEDTNGEGRLHELNIPTFLAIRSIK